MIVWDDKDEGKKEDAIPSSFSSLFITTLWDGSELPANRKNEAERGNQSGLKRDEKKDDYR